MHAAKLLCILLTAILLDGCQHKASPAPLPRQHASASMTGLAASSYPWRWHGDSRVSTLPGTMTQQKQALAQVLAHSDEAEPTSLLLAANTALRLKRLEDAGFLYQAALVRRGNDMARFPPLPGEQPWLQRIEALRLSTARRVSTRLLDAPETYARVAKRLTAWSCETRTSYLPVWRAQNRKSGSDCRTQARERARALLDIATLMRVPGYAEAAQLTRYYLDGSPSVRALPGLKAQYQSALADMARIEREHDLEGLSARMR